ncbi:hypothetical protein EIN_526330 [Entamoeba invadens IP1]|uniref:Uncharacterized protein n=1 Tax=Entamoeba invadens IP1 TaxID=370355 RepID=A0A0A1U5K6_ENTIV|nr:hypothetical protein EIN_526330 [Entamoeba invadens IP1]ELP89608.1 hypothetical protein EIN_526330 [Entamoeba invadens IP1]|eukprot:XP_004256379.1 hypothetical protein EIN_526330 [Entamoeba invadens IP1]
MLCHNMDKKHLRITTRGPGKSEKYKNYRNYQVCQQSVFLLIISKYASVELNKPIKRSIATLQFLNVKQITFGKNDVIKVSEFNEERCVEKMERERKNGINDKEALQRFENFKFVEALHFLGDILLELGFQFSVKWSPGKHNTEKAETVNAIFYKGKKIFNIESIKEVGKEVNKYIHNMVKTRNTFVMNSSDVCLNSLLQLIIK